MIIDWWRTICELLSIFKLCTWTYVILYRTSIAKKFIVMFWNFHSFYLSLCPFTGSKYASWIRDVSYHEMEQNVCAPFTPISVSLFANLHDSLTLGRLWLQSHSSTAESVHLFGLPIKKIMTNNLFSTFVKWKNLTSLLWLYSSASTNILCNSSEWHGDFWSVSAHQMHSMLFIIFCFIQERKNCCRMQMSMPVMILQRKCALTLGVLPLSCILRLLIVLYFWWMGYHPCFLW